MALIPGCNTDDENTTAEDALLHFYSQTYNTQVYWVDQEPSEPQVGDVRLESLELLGETTLEESTASLYSVTMSVLGQQNEALQWVTMEPDVEVLIWAGDGDIAEILTPIDAVLSL